MKTILLIEDNDEMRENTAEILEMADYQVITAENGKEGVELAELAKPDLIISDLSMPRLNGFEVIKSLKQSIKIKNTPFIFLTARNENENRETGRNLGAVAYLTKPYNGTELLKVISESLK